MKEPNKAVRTEKKVREIPNPNSEIRKVPPPPGQPRNVTYPEVEEAKLENGLRVVVVRDEQLPRFAVRLGMPVGRVSAPSENLAFPALALDMLSEGTERRTSRQLAWDLEQYAIQRQSEMLMEFCLLSVMALGSFLEKAVEILADMVLFPTFPEKELRKLRTRWLSDLKSQRSDPEFLGRERFFHSYFEDHPYRRVSTPPEHLNSVNREGLHDFFRREYCPNHSFLLFAGPIHIESAVRLAKEYFGNWRAQPSLAWACPPVQAGPRRQVLLVHRPHSVQSRVLVGGGIPGKRDPVLMDFRMANQVFGGGASSRLFLNLRERRGYTYGAYSSMRTYQQGGVFLAAADVNADKTLPAITETLNELEKMCESEPESKELLRSRAEIAGTFVRQMETASSVGELELQRRLNRLPSDYYTTFLPKLYEVGPERVLEASRRFFRPERLLIVVVGDRDQLQKDLERLGGVTVFDDQGGPLQES